MIKKIRICFKKINRAKRIKKRKGKIAPYLKSDFSAELNYKLWTTKGARFQASQRNKKLNSLSTQTIGYLSAYLIIINLGYVYDFSFVGDITANQIGIITTALSILILIYSLFENAKNHSLKAEKFHQCGLEIAELYNELRMVKTYNLNANINSQVQAISEKYDVLLRKYENHDPVDFLSFKSSKPKYFELSVMHLIFLAIEKYFRIKFHYHLMIYGPLIWFCTYHFIK